ncbi:MAG: hypothetical protein R3E79_07495 [Caldilineaceae bacterium]
MHIKKSKDDPISNLRTLIHYEEHRILKSFPLERRKGLIDIVRSMDLLWFSYKMGANPDIDQVAETIKLFSYGLNKALFLFMDASCSLPGYPLGRSNKESQQWADSVLLHCGRLGAFELILEICRVGLGSIWREKPNVYHFAYASGPLGIEAFEAEDFVWRLESVAHRQTLQHMALEAKQARIWESMFNSVDVWRKDYIMYDTNPEIDDFYSEVGFLHSERMFGQDSFPKHAKFGNQTFDLFQSTVITLIGWTFKHISFCTQLMKKAPYINPRNIYSIPYRLSDKAKYLAAALNVDFEAAKQALEVLTLTQENRQHHCMSSGYFAAPAAIQVGQDMAVVPIWGCTSHPFIFMLNELKRKYRADWDRAVEAREDIFREELYSLFQSSRYYKLDRNVNIKLNGSVVTDIDAIVFDRFTGTLALFQLKWQDLFGNSLRERESRKKNFYQTGNQWVAKLCEWLNLVTSEQLSELIGLATSEGKQLSATRLFVIGRNSAHFSGSGSLDSRAAWGTWYQFSRTMERVNQEDTINSLFAMLIENSPLNRERPKLPVEELQIRNTRIIIEST